MRATMVEYIEKKAEVVTSVAGDFWKHKGQTLADYLHFIRAPGNKGDELVIHILACMTNLRVVVVTKTRFWSTVMDCDPLSADVILVYLGKSTFRDTVPIPIPPKKIPIPIDDDTDTELNEHEETKFCDPNRRITRSMGHVPHVNTPSPSHPSPPSTEMKKPKPKHRKKRKTRVVKEKKYILCRCCRCMTRKCSLCGKKFASAQALNIHVTDKHEYKFFYKFRKCRSEYSSQTSADRHIRHHSPPRYQCEHCECPHCGKKYRWRSSVLIHIRTKHPDLAKKKGK